MHAIMRLMVASRRKNMAALSAAVVEALGAVPVAPAPPEPPPAAAAGGTSNLADEGFILGPGAGRQPRGRRQATNPVVFFYLPTQACRATAPPRRCW